MALTVIGIELHLKLKWIGWSTILKHKRTMLKVRYANFFDLQMQRIVHVLKKTFLQWKIRLLVVTGFKISCQFERRIMGFLLYYISHDVCFNKNGYINIIIILCTTFLAVYVR